MKEKNQEKDKFFLSIINEEDKIKNFRGE